MSSDGRFLAAPDNYGKTFLWDTTTFERLDPPLSISDFAASGALFTPDSRMLLTSAGDRGQELTGIQFWDLETRQMVDHINNGFFQFAEGGVALSADGRILAMGGRRRWPCGI